MNITPISPNSVQNTTQVRNDSKTGSPVSNVSQTFDQALQSLSQDQFESDALLEKLAAGESVDLHQVMIATEQTDINFRVAVAIRDRLVEAYREVSRMAV